MYWPAEERNRKSRHAGGMRAAGFGKIYNICMQEFKGSNGN